MTQLSELQCPNCGATLATHGPAPQAACPHCGTQLLVQPKPIPLAAAHEALACPFCGQVDLVQKVSVIYSSGFSRGRFSGWDFDRDGRLLTVSGTTRTQTELSRLLSPPGQPSGAGWGEGLLFLVGVASLLVVAPIGLGISLMVALVPYWGGMGDYDPITHITLWIFFGFLPGLFAVGGLALGIVLPWISMRTYRSKRDRAPTKRAAWSRAMVKWEQLYYCARDDGLFIPGETGFIPLTHMDGFLFAD